VCIVGIESNGKEVVQKLNLEISRLRCWDNFKEFSYSMNMRTGFKWLIIGFIGRL